MPQQKRPITERPKVEDESTGNGTQFHGVHRHNDEALRAVAATRRGSTRTLDAPTTRRAPRAGARRKSTVSAIRRIGRRGRIRLRAETFHPEERAELISTS